MEASLCSPTQSLLHWHCMACLPPTYSPEPTRGKKGALRQTKCFGNPESSRPNPCPLAVCRSSEGGGTQNKTNVGYCKWQRETTDHIGAASRIKHSPISRFLPKAPHLEFLLMLYPKVKKPELMKEWLCFYISNHQITRSWISRSVPRTLFSSTASPFFLLLGEMLLVGEMQAEEKWFIQNLTIALEKGFTTTSPNNTFLTFL